MCCSGDFVRGTEDRRRRRRFICECREVRGDRNRRHHRHCGCGCGGHRHNCDVVLDCRCRESRD